MKSSFQKLASKASVLSVLLLQAAKPADGHYGFPIAIINGVASEWWEFTRPVGFGSYTGQFFPIYDWTAEGQVCGFNGTKTGHLTGTAKIEAGSEIGFRAIPATYNDGIIAPRAYNFKNDVIGHVGPGAAYMSKAPGDLESYEGDGDWFKIGVSGASDGMYWDSPGKNEMNFTIPKTTPPGKYLVRVEHFNISPYYNSTQQFINCAQVEVSGAGGGTPGPMIKFPGGYDLSDPGIWLPRALFYPKKPMDGLKNWKGAGPVVWTG
ncbi:glycosyl hydrolase family 61-domain-containing protein [Massariosphaeria phaeospora]|uniref:lytic cellulose monooxygenase (C4-dehydrogenating) n=1 Tax=Massariosphaeria phaeospora TaxID=100035 RepID=A0A7C8M9C5_9PLEO|nr:glycosyl hydrolase family 61-domain-containing protein [Massariosphaeria phaeospora]